MTAPPDLDAISAAFERIAAAMRPVIEAAAEGVRRFSRLFASVVRDDARWGLGDPPDDQGRWWSHRCATALGLDELHALCRRPFLTRCACHCHRRDTR